MIRRSSRSPLLSSLRELLRAASQEEHKNISRRDFLKKSALASSVIAATPLLSTISFAKDSPKVVIVGAGIAGLNAAYKLRKAGIIAQVYEASNHFGGRIMTTKDILGPRLTTELGGEFIDSDHTEMIALAKEFGLELRDRKPAADRLIERAYYFGGKLRTEKEVITEISPFLEKIKHDAFLLPKNISYENPGQAMKLDRTSMADYFHQLGITGWIKDLLDAAFISEFGLETADQSAMNFITTIGTDLTKGFQIFGSSDERLVVHGGNSRFIDKLSSHLPDQINTTSTLEAIRSRNKGFTLSFISYGVPKDVDADFVILALPFTMLRSVDIKDGLPDWKKKAIAELGYGHHTKLISGFTKRIWNDQGYSGEVFSDTNFQLAWDSSQTQSSESGSLTSFAGGNLAAALTDGSIAGQSDKFTADLDKVFPGIAHTSNGKSTRYDWTNYKYTKGSYSCYKPGQYTSIRGAEGKPIGKLFFAGEHTSLDYQGFMNGGAESGKRAAEEIITLLK